MRVVTPAPVMIVMMIVHIGDRIVVVLDFILFGNAHENTLWTLVVNAPIWTNSLLLCRIFNSASASAMAISG
jgi:GTP-dependent phosphoenolpyruvate carboxykinase